MDDSPNQNAAPHRPPRRKQRGYPFIIATIAGVGLILVVLSGVSGGRYSLEISEVAKRSDQYIGKPIRIVGKIKEGWTERRVGSRIETHFVVEDDQGNQISVVYPHNRPDPFKEGRLCIVEGTYQKGGILRGTKLTVKCPSKYQSENDFKSGDGDSLDTLRKRYQPKTQR